MDLEAMQQIIYASSPQDWKFWDMPYRPAGDDYRGRATFRNDVALELWWGRVITESFTEPWTANFTDSTAQSFGVEATYAGAVVLQEAFVHLDGGHFLIPMPRLVSTNRGDSSYQVSERQLKLARTLHGLAGSSGHDPDAGIRLAGIVVAS